MTVSDSSSVCLHYDMQQVIIGECDLNSVEVLFFVVWHILISKELN